MDALFGLKLVMQDVRKLRILLFVLTGEYEQKMNKLELSIRIVQELLKSPTDDALKQNFLRTHVFTLNIYIERLGGTKPKGSSITNEHAVYETAMVKAFRAFIEGIQN